MTLFCSLETIYYSFICAPKAHHFQSSGSSGHPLLCFIINCVPTYVTMKGVIALYTPLHQEKCLLCIKFLNIYHMHKIWIEYLMISQGQCEKGSYVRSTEGKQNLIFTLEN